jgi:hypothetical protein
VEQLRYLQPRPASWPAADYIVGNPPFIGAASMRQALGDGYVEALRAAYPAVPESADLVMFWWHCAAQLLAEGRIHRFGFITTNSLTQTFNRRVLEAHLNPNLNPPQPPFFKGGSHAQVRPAAIVGLNPPLEKGGRFKGGSHAQVRSAAIVGLNPPLKKGGRGDLDSGLHLAFAIPDHPWVDSADGAAVRVAMTVAAPGDGAGRLLRVANETPGNEGEVNVEFAEANGLIHANLQIGANVSGAGALRANGNISSPGFKLHGAGFIVNPDEAASLGNPPIVHEYRNGRDLTDKPRGVMLIDTWGLSELELRQQYPAVWQRLAEHVKPERDAKAHSKDGAGYAKHWWMHGKPRPELRKMFVGLPRYIATVETAKHRVFQFLDAGIAPDNMLVCIAHDDAWVLGVLSSRVHVVWALAAGGRLGVGNDPRYNKTRCFEPFPFPAATPEQQARIRALAEQLDAHRKRQQAAHPELTLTGLYNVLEKLRNGEALAAKDKRIHEQGLASVLKQLHDELDAEVLQAYGWDAAPDAVLLERLVDLNAERAREEAGGTVRWLRPDFQTRGAPVAASRTLDLPEAAAVAVAAGGKLAWPADLPGQLGALAQALRAFDRPVSVAELAAAFAGKRGLAKTLPGLLAALQAVARARLHDDGRVSAG